MTPPARGRPARWRPPPDTHPAVLDGERVRPGPVAQPANALSSAAYLAAGAWLEGRHRRAAAIEDPGVGAVARAVALALAVDGVGGVGFHGPGDRASRWLHDVGLLVTVSALGVVDLVGAGRLTQRGGVLALGGIGAGAAIAVGARPDRTNAWSAVVGAGALVATVLALRGQRPASDRRSVRLRVLAAVLAGAGAALNRAGRRGGPWHRPDAALQGHALWHVLTAAALAAWTEAALPARTPARRGGPRPHR